MTYRFSDDTAEMNIDLIHHWLSVESYWAVGRSREVHDAAMHGSRNYGMFDDRTGEQVAYARVITDAATFAWLCDVFVTPEVRGAGVGVTLIDRIVAQLEPLALKRMMLVTKDAHGLYEKFGFSVPAEPELIMARM